MNALPQTQATRFKILVVDDVEANLRVVCRRLESENYELHPVESGEKALRFIEEHKPDLVLLDYMMPRMNGVEVLNVVRKDWGIEDLPIIMLTARAEAEAVVSALEAGADDYISKPIDFDVLKARMQTQLSKVQSRDSLKKANAALDERSAMRVLAFDQLREELEREIGLRKRAEHALDMARANLPVVSTTKDDEIAQIEGALEILDRIIEAAKVGKPANLALLGSIRAKLVQLIG